MLENPPITPYWKIKANQDQATDWLMEHAPWHRIHLKKLYTKKEIRGWANDTYIHLYAAIPYELTQTHNLLIDYHGLHMILTVGAAPEFTRFKNQHSMELLAYYPWMGS